jgi:hypothetical protein
MWPRVEHEVIAIQRPRDDVAAGRQHARRPRPRRTGGDDGIGGRHPPIHFFGRRPDGERGIGEHRRRDPQRHARIRRTRAAPSTHLPAVIVADERHLAVVVGDRAEVLGLRARRALEHRRRRIPRRARDQQRQQIEVGRVAVVVRRELDVAAIGADLPDRFGDQHVAAASRPRAARAQFRQRLRDGVERERLAREMRVGAEVQRQVVDDVCELPVDGDQEIDEPRRAILLAPVAEELEAPRPRDAAERELQHAGPVDAVQRRIGGEPALQLAHEHGAIRGVAGQPPGTSERDPMLMSVELPDDLVIAARRVEIGHRRPEGLRRAPPVHHVEVPRRRRAIRENAVAEQIVRPLGKAVGARSGTSRGVG